MKGTLAVYKVILEASGWLHCFRGKVPQHVESPDVTSFHFLCRVKASAAEVSFWTALCREVVELRRYPVSGRALFGETLRHRPGGPMSARAHVARHGDCSPVLRLTAHDCSSCIFMLDVCPATCEAISA